jgi:hypothetical protein
MLIMLVVLVVLVDNGGMSAKNFFVMLMVFYGDADKAYGGILGAPRWGAEILFVALNPGAAHRGLPSDAPR